MSNPLYISDVVQRNMISLYGDVGKQWLENLSPFISHYENQWHFKASKCFSDAQFNVVLNTIKNDSVFKCCVTNKEFKTEVKALAHYNGHGAVKLLKYDIENGAMLLEKINPGSLLENVISIEEATKKAVATCKKLHKPVENKTPFPTLRDWFNGFDKKI